MEPVNRVDEIEKYYKPIETCDRWVNASFWAGVLLSFAIPYLDNISAIWLRQIISVLFIISVIAHSIFANYNRFFLLPGAEEKRRKQLLSDAFEVPLTQEETQQYYNNPLEPSIARLGACVLENTFFAKSVCHEMAKIQRVKVLFYGLLWVGAIAFSNTDIGIILALTQFLFSGEILFRLVNIERLYTQNNKIYDALYQHFLNQISSNEKPGIAKILDSFAAYESAKASSSIKQSSKIFHKLNPELSKEWNRICRKLNITNDLQST